MKRKPKTFLVAFATTGLGLTLSSSAASVVVDWLTLAGGSTPGAFTLLDDGGLTGATGALVADAGKGLAFPLSSQLFNAAYWSAASDLTDSVALDTQVSATNFRVAPQNGQASYQIRLAVPADQELVLAIGGLYRTATNATQSLAVSALTDSSSSAVTLHQVLGWNNGITAYNQDVEWDETTDILTTTVGSVGESEVVFVRIAPLSGSNPRLVLSVPNGYNLGTGDAISIGLGLVPEPGVFALLGLGGLLVLGGRRR